MSALAKDFWLVVEDDDNDYLLFYRACARALKGQPRIHRENDGAAAKAYLTETGEAPCLIVSDLNMPQMNGLELLDWVRHQDAFSKVPFVILSSSSADRDVQSAHALGADHYQVKPLDPGLFLRLLKQLNTLSPLPEPG
jgi:CheY-like chemotaxis protein